MKKLKGLIIENFQSHEFTQVDFAPGFNVIVGASDQGKSALIRALKWLYFNEPRGADFIRVGATGCRVTVLLADDTQVSRERTPSRNRYYVQYPGREEEVFEGFGSRVPREVEVALGVVKTKLDEGLETVLNLGEQLEAPFLLAEAGSVKAKAMGRLYGVHIVDAALRETVRDMNRAQQEERRLGEQLKEIASALEEYADLPRLAELVEKLTAQLGELDKLAGRLDTCRKLKEEREAVEGFIGAANGILEKMGGLAQSEGLLAQVSELASRCSRGEEYRRDLLRVQAEIGQAEEILAAARGLEAAQEKAALALECQRLGKELADLYKEKRRAERVIAATREVLQHTEGVEQAAANLRLFQEKEGTVGKMAELQRELVSAWEKGKKAQEAAAAAARDLKRQLAQYGALLKKLGKCPICYGDITAATIRGILSEYTGEEG
ncbi:MAG TPA: AAA family ATPase [Firmicutes bacterium]|nr:AAA family ATPase [Bacillota bacterium]